MSRPSCACATERRRIKSEDGVEIYAEATRAAVSAHPDSPDVLFIHGNSTSTIVWDRQFNDPEWRQRFRMIRMDLRGHGNSGVPADPTTGFDWTAQGADVHAVLEAFQVPKNKGVIIVSWSYGAVIVADYVARYGADRLRALVTLCVVHGSLDEARHLFTVPNLQGIADPTNADLMHQRFDTFISCLAKDPLPKAEHLLLKGMLCDVNSTTRQWIFRRKQNFEPFRTQVMSSIPELFMTGDSDKMHPAQESVEWNRSKYGKGLFTGKLIEGSSHFPHWEQPEAFKKAVFEWYDALP